MLSAEIIAIGTELLTPRFNDTNSVYLTQRLNEAGIPVVMKTIVGDDEGHLEHALRSAMDRTPVVIAMGGLGPTEDDLTRPVVARVLQRKLKTDSHILKALENRFKSRGIEMPQNNARQAMVLEGADVLPNRHGTAPGQWAATEGHQIILLPGPFTELRPMFDEYCFSRLHQLAGGVALARRVYRTTGLPESSLDARIAPIYEKYKNPQTTILAKPGQVEVRLAALGKTAAEAEQIAQELAEKIEAELREYIFTNDERNLEEVVGELLTLKNATISVAESCTGGLVAERLTNVPGSSKYFMTGLVCYSNQSKIDLAGIPPLLLEMEGAVSEEVARGLAEAVREKIQTTIGIGVTGIAGPGGGSADKPVGTVHIAVASPQVTRHQRFVFPSDRERIRWQASQAALNMTRMTLLEL